MKECEIKISGSKDKLLLMREKFIEDYKRYLRISQNIPENNFFSEVHKKNYLNKANLSIDKVIEIDKILLNMERNKSQEE